MTETYRTPGWVPKWRAWTMAFRLAIPTYALATIAPAFEVWRFCLLGYLLSFYGIEDVLIVFAVSLVSLLLGLLWFLSWAGAYALLLKLLWSNPPNWLRLPKLSVLINQDFGVLLAATLPLVFVLFAHVGFRVSFTYRLSTISSFRLSYETFLLEFSWLWFASAVFAYHFYYKSREWARRRSRKRGAL